METARGVTAFYDIDTPVTLASVERGDSFYLSADLIRQYQLYLSFTGGPILERLERHYGAPMARALYCAVDADLYGRWRCQSAGIWATWELTAPIANRVCKSCCSSRPAVAPARMVVAGPQYPSSIEWPGTLSDPASGAMRSSGFLQPTNFYP